MNLRGDLWKEGVIYESGAYLEKKGVIYHNIPSFRNVPNIANQGLIHRRWNDRFHSISFHFNPFHSISFHSIPFHSITFPNPFQFHTFELRQDSRAHESFEFLRYIQYSVFSIQYSIFIPIVLLPFPDIYLISL
jgi:hypothetical protein